MRQTGKKKRITKVSVFFVVGIHGACDVVLFTFAQHHLIIFNPVHIKS